MVSDPALLTGLINIGAAAIVSVAIALFDPGRGLRSALFVAVCLTALANFHFQRRSTAALNSQIEAMQINRWDPLTESEGARFSSILAKLPKPNKRLQVLCGSAGCNDLAQSIRIWANQAGWKVEIAVPIFGSSDVPFEFFFKEDADLAFPKALEDAARPRFQINYKKFDGNVDDQINLFIGNKP
jgi:hypothetical protein